MAAAARGGGRIPWHFAGGAWSIIVPILILVLLFLGVLRSAPVPTASPESKPVTVLVPTFERLPAVLGGHYEVWVERPEGGGERLSAFTVLGGGQLLTLGGEPVQEFPVAELPPVGSRLLLTVEPGNEPAITRSDRVLLSGTLSATEAALEPDVAARAGTHSAMLLAPTDPNAPETSGLWFGSPRKAKGRPAAGLQLNPPADGWVYAGFVTTAAGTVLPTGAFRDVSGPDGRSPFSGSGRGLNVPGEDFVTNAPEGTAFPVNLADGRTTVAVGLLPDFAASAPEPFLPLLAARIPYRQNSGQPFVLEPASADTLPKGAVRFEQRSS